MWPKSRRQWLATINLGYNPQMRALIATLIALMLFATTTVAAGAGTEGLTTAQAQKGFRSFKPLAEQGNPLAQFNLGNMYNKGKGVPEDHAKAVHWYTKAAKQGYARAQFSLGLMYAKGEGVPENDLRAYAWSSIAAARGHAKGKNFKEIIVKLMTPAQIAEAQKLSSELWEKYVLPFQ